MVDSGIIRAAVVQAAPVAFDLEASLLKVEALAAEAAGQGAQLVVFPEAFLSAYPKGHDFGAKVGSRSPEGRRWFARYWESSVEIPGPVTERLAAVARDNDLHVVIGVIERAQPGTLYCTALMLDSTGAIVGRHRKLMPTGIERLVWGQGDSSTLTVADTSLGKLGAVICWENYMPLLRTAMYQQGVQLYCAPTVDDRDNWQATMRHVACEGRCFVLASCQFATRGDFPDDYDTPYGDDPDTVLIRGGSAIVDPLGEVLAGPVYGETAILHAELDMGRIVEGKYDLDVVGHYARPDVFELVVK